MNPGTVEIHLVGITMQNNIYAHSPTISPIARDNDKYQREGSMNYSHNTHLDYSS